jgi:hypothetical protein
MVKPMLFILCILCLIAFVKLAIAHNKEVGISLKDIWNKLFKEERE